MSQIIVDRPVSTSCLEECDNLPDPDVLAQEIVDDLETPLEQFREIATDLRGQDAEPQKS